jgi:glycosyltransferase involved in cell wall biosynthesis
MKDQQKRVAIFIPDMRGGGAQRVAMNLCRGISERGHLVDLVLAEATGPYLAEIPESVHLVDLRARRILLSLPALVRYLREEKPAALLSFLHYANIVALWARRLARCPKRVVVTEHNTLSSSVENALGLALRLMPQLTRLFYPWADAVVAVSQGVADDLAQRTGISRKRIQVIYNPVVTPQLREKARTRAEHPWFRDANQPVIVAVGRLTAQKDFSTLIRAFACVRRTRAVRLLILGEGEERPQLEALVKQLCLDQDVSLPGFVPNPYPYMAQASLFILSSRWEGLPTVLVEALYCGTPIVSTDCPSGPREILRGGQYGRLVPVADVASLARAIEIILDNRGNRPPRESVKPFEMETIVRQYMSIMCGD